MAPYVAAKSHTLETDQLTGLGREASLFLPAPYTSIDPGEQGQTALQYSAARPWRLVANAEDATVEEAKLNPNIARQLFGVLCNFILWSDRLRRVGSNSRSHGLH